MFTRLGQDKENDGQQVPVSVTPPKKRVLRVSARKRRRAWEWQRRSGEEEGRRTDGHFSENERDLLVNDDEEDGEAVPPESTSLPVARVLPNSFFMQLVVSDNLKVRSLAILIEHTSS